MGGEVGRFGRSRRDGLMQSSVAIPTIPLAESGNPLRVAFWG